MTIRKFAAASIIDARMGSDTLMKGAHRAIFTYTPRPGYLYVRSRAISSRCNDNFDMFPAEEIAKAYKTFIGKPVFVNHHNEDHRRARGVILDAVLHRDVNPDGSPDTWAEVLHEVDALKFPMLAKAILAGEVNRTSMGCDVSISKCSVCDNEATSPLEYCAHIPGKKGKRIVQAGSGKPGEREARLVFEICSGLSFFENSLLVEPPADPTAYFLGDVEVGPGLESMAASVKKTASADNERDQHDRFVSDHPEYAMDPDETEMFHQFTLHQDGPSHLPHYRNMDELMDRHVVNDYGDLDDTGEREYRAHREHYDREPDQSFGKFKPEDWTRPSPTQDTGHGPRSYEAFPEYRMAPYHPKFHSMNSLREMPWQRTAAKAGSSLNSTWDLIKVADLIGDDLDNDLTVESAKTHPEAYLAGQKHWPAMAPIPGSRPGMKDSDKAWFAKNPVGVHHILNHYTLATDEERRQGKLWYPEVGHGAAVLVQAHNPDLSYEEARHRGAGIVSAFSPQSEFHSNMLNAFTTARLGSAPASARKRSEPSPADAHAHMAMEMNSINADKIAKGAHPNEVLAGPKTHAFYHNLAHAGQESDLADCNCPHTHVTVDAHALSVAVGRRIRPKEDGTPDMSDYHAYHHVANAYRSATHLISRNEGRDVHPSEVQAVTWLVRQRLNNDKAQTTKSRNTREKLFKHLKEHGFDPDEVMGASKSNHQKAAAWDYYYGLVREGMIKTAYGETVAPQDVDTLRAENCTICGNSTAFDGVQCQICGYVAPPRPFGDPDTDSAKNNDMRKDVLDSADGTADPNDPDQQLGNQIGDPEELDDQEQEASLTGTTPPITCTNCQTTITPAPAQTGGEPPYPAEGDVCPVCKKGELLSDQDPSEDADQDGVPDDEEVEGDDEPGDESDDKSDDKTDPSKPDKDEDESDEDDNKKGKKF